MSGLPLKVERLRNSIKHPLGRSEAAPKNDLFGLEPTLVLIFHSRYQHGQMREAMDAVPARKYDSSLSPALDWDGENSARQEGEALYFADPELRTLEAALQLP